MAENQDSDKFGLRLLIALYAAGIVALGLPALKKHYGGLNGFLSTLKKKTEVFAIDPEGRDVAQPGREREKSAEQPTKSAESKGKKGAGPHMDNLKQSDRKQLNDLVNTL